jgi:hypothetical protein
MDGYVPFEFTNLRVPFPALHPGQPPDSVERLPAGLELACKSRWGSSESKERELGPVLQTELNLAGPFAQRLLAWRVDLHQARLADGKSLEPEKEVAPPSDAADGGEIEWSAFSPESSREMQRIIMPFLNPHKPVSEIESLQGVLQLQVSTESEEVTWNVRDGRIEHPVLAKAGVRLAMAQVGPIYRLTIEEGNPFAIRDVELVGQPRDEPGRRPMFRAASGDRPFYSIPIRPGSADADVRFTVHYGLETVEVPFRFNAVPVPDPPVR